MAISPPAKPSKLETVGGSALTESALTVVGALAGGILAPLLPVLAKSLASERQRQRVESYLNEVHEALTGMGERLRDLTDEQYKVLNEVILSALHTTEQGKLDYLKKVVLNTPTTARFDSQEAVLLSRIVRDISAQEAAFLAANFSYRGVHVFAPDNATTVDILRVTPNSREASIVSGLLSLGLLTPGEPTWGAPNVMIFSPIAAKFLALIK
jgi:hypothetical protein